MDVDEYWKKTIRSKEEDAWLIEPGDMPVEAGLRKGELVIVLVRGGKNWATDDECGLLQKYKGRRMQEFDNTRMKAVLVGNYFSAIEAKDRPNPFSATQIEEAQKDGNGLLTTYELFRAVKAEKENRISKDAIREQIKLKTGLDRLRHLNRGHKCPSPYGSCPVGLPGAKRDKCAGATPAHLGTS